MFIHINTLVEQIYYSTDFLNDSVICKICNQNHCKFLYTYLNSLKPSRVDLLLPISKDVKLLGS